MNIAAIALSELLKQPIWLILGAVVLVLVIALILLLVQWKRVAYKKQHPQTVDWTVEAGRAVEQAEQMLKSGLLAGMRAEFGANAPLDMARLQQYISDAYGLRTGGFYVSVDALSAFVHHVPHVFLQGSDIVGGESVVPLKVSETGERYFYLEGIAVCYRREGFRYTVKYNIRFFPEKTNQSIEDVLDFETV